MPKCPNCGGDIEYDWSYPEKTSGIKPIHCVKCKLRGIEDKGKILWREVRVRLRPTQ